MIYSNEDLNSKLNELPGKIGIKLDDVRNSIKAKSTANKDTAKDPVIKDVNGAKLHTQHDDI